jgi:lipopolysaccharide transport system permease protein
MTPVQPRSIRIDPTSKRKLIDGAELWRFREVVYFLAWRDFKVRYRQTYLGFFWAILQPLIAMSVFTVLFGRLIGVSSNGTQYPLFVLCGVVVWNFFSRAVGSMAGSLVGNQELVKRVYFPRIIIPFASIATCFADLSIGLLLTLLAIVSLGQFPDARLACLPLFVLVMAIASLGLGLALSAINVRFRDIGYLVPFGLQTLLFVTPVVYPGSLVPVFWRPLYSLNPMAGVVEGARWSLLGTPLDWAMFGISATSALILFGAGMVIFSRSERAFPDLI